MHTLAESDDQMEIATFEQFPNELIEEVVSYLPGNDVLRSFLNLNTRFTDIIRSGVSTIDLSSWTLTETIELFKNASTRLPTNHLSLKLSNRPTCGRSSSAHIEFIFSNLIDGDDQWRFFLQNLHKLTLVRPIIEPRISLPDCLLRTFVVHSFRDRIVFRRAITSKPMASVIICSSDMMRSLLADHGGVYDQILVSYDNPIVDSLIPSVRHVKLYIDCFRAQWPLMQRFIVNTLAELTLVVIDDEYYCTDGYEFSLLFVNLATHCPLHFYLQVTCRRFIFPLYSPEFYQSFESDFYTQHESHVLITHNGDRDSLDHTRLIYTSPCCSPVLSLGHLQDVEGIRTDYSQVNRLVFQLRLSLRRHEALLIPQLTTLHLPNVTSAELVYSLQFESDPRGRLWSHPLTQHLSGICHLHIRSRKYSLRLPRDQFTNFPTSGLRHLDLTDDSLDGSLFGAVLDCAVSFPQLLHLNLFGASRLCIEDIQRLSSTFGHLQTLTFSMELLPSYDEQLETIFQFILLKMSGHLRYVHIYFDRKNDLLVPSEIQLSTWLGDNQSRLSHMHAIILNRRELLVWM